MASSAIPRAERLASGHRGARVAIDKKPPVAKIVLDTTEPVRDMLEQLVKTGLFGVTVEACAEELLRERLREIEAQGFVR